MIYAKIRKFFSHDITLLILSFVISFIVLFIINSNSTTDTNITISDIPISIELSQEARDNGLQVFSGDDVKGSVEVTGNRATVASLKGTDLLIVATNAGNITSSGNYTLVLTAKKTGTKTNYNIISSTLSPSTLTVYVDKFKEKEYEIDNQIKVTAPEGKYVTCSLDNTKVTLSGPGKIIDTIYDVAIIDEISSVKSGDEKEEELVFLDENNNVVDSQLITSDISSVNVTFNVLEKQDVTLKLNILNGPKNEPNINLSPSKISVACTDEGKENLTDGSIAIADIDFSTLTNTVYSEKFSIDLPDGVINLSNSSTVIARMDFSSYSEREISCSLMSTLDADDYIVEMTNKTVSVKVVGPENQISKIKAGDISTVLDFSNLLENVSKQTVSLDVPVKCTISDNYPDCWINGTYSVNVNVTKK